MLWIGLGLHFPLYWECCHAAMQASPSASMCGVGLGGLFMELAARVAKAAGDVLLVAVSFPSADLHAQTETWLPFGEGCTEVLALPLEIHSQSHSQIFC